MMVGRKLLVPYRLQFFAEGGEEGSNDTQQGGEGSGSQGGQEDAQHEEDQQGGAGQGQRTFTQDEVDRMMTREKKQGKNSILKSLGFKSESEAKNAVKLLNALMDSQKTPEEKEREKASGAEAEKEDAERRADAAENKLACIMAGVAKDSVDDVLAIALLKVSDKKDLDKVLEEMKKEKRYASFFGGEDASGNGTGNDPGHSGGAPSGGSAKGSFGKEVASLFLGTDQKKSSFFKEG